MSKLTEPPESSENKVFGFFIRYKFYELFGLFIFFVGFEIFGVWITKTFSHNTVQLIITEALSPKSNIYNLSYFEYWAIGLWVCWTLIVIILGICVIGYLLIEWIKSNWRMATIKAETPEEKKIREEKEEEVKRIEARKKYGYGPGDKVVFKKLEIGKRYGEEDYGSYYVQDLNEANMSGKTCTIKSVHYNGMFKIKEYDYKTKNGGRDGHFKFSAACVKRFILKK